MSKRFAEGNSCGNNGRILVWREFVVLSVVFLPSWVGSQTVDTFRIQATSEVVSNSNERLVKVEAHYPNHPDVVWNLLNRIEAYPEYIPRVHAAERLGLEKGNERVFVLLDVPVLPNVWNIVLLKRNSEARRLEWEMAEGNMRKNIGSLVVEAGSAGSRVRLEALVDLGSIFPQRLVAWGVKKYLPKALLAIGRRLTREPLELPRKKLPATL